MNELLRYEEEIVNLLPELPLPDENEAWLDMKHRLEKKDDDGVIFFFRRGCGLVILLVIVLLGIGWWLLKPGNWAIQKRSTNNDTVFNRNQDDKKIDRKNNRTEKNSTIDISSHPTAPQVDLTSSTENKTKRYFEKINSGSRREKDIDLKRIKTQFLVAKKNSSKQLYKVKDEGANPVKPDLKKIKTSSDTLFDYDLKEIAGKIREDIIKDTFFSTDSSIGTDSAMRYKRYKVDSLKRDSINTRGKQENKKTADNKYFSFAAGISLQQPIPFGGQNSVPYNYYGRRGTIADYIPSIYLRLYRDRKWFIQSEFKYGTPEYVKQFAYNTQSILDSSGSGIIRSFNLKKTYYHQVPVSFNYYISPGWSIGTGIMWSKFYGAVAEEEVKLRDGSLQTDSVIRKSILQVKATTDSFFTKSQLNWLIESQYKWKRFSFGLRYSQGLQPYIKYADASGTPLKKKNQSLQFFIRYEIWKSNPFKGMIKKL